MKLLLSLVLLVSTLLSLDCQNAAPTPSIQPSTVVISNPARDSVPVADTLALSENQQKSTVHEMKSAPANSGTPSQTKPFPNTKPVTPAQNGFTEVVALDASIRLDIRYATTNNFTKAKIYDCPRCLLRPEAAEALVKAHKMLQKKGLGLKMFDCYRPRPYQQRLWDKVPNADYVTPPAKGSMHSRGAAVDLTIVDANGKELDMGTPYDFLGSRPIPTTLTYRPRCWKTVACSAKHWQRSASKAFVRNGGIFHFREKIIPCQITCGPVISELNSYCNSVQNAPTDPAADYTANRRVSP